VGETFGDSAVRAMRQRMKDSPTGQQILAERPRVTVSGTAISSVSGGGASHVWTCLPHPQWHCSPAERSPRLAREIVHTTEPHAHNMCASHHSASRSLLKQPALQSQKVAPWCLHPCCAHCSGVAPRVRLALADTPVCVGRDVAILVLMCVYARACACCLGEVGHSP
jgi:hypothetical protein